MELNINVDLTTKTGDLPAGMDPTNDNSHFTMKDGGVTDMHLRCRTQHQTQLMTLAPRDVDGWHRFAYLRYQHFPSIHVRFSWSRSMDRASRVAQFEEILAGISALLTLCGKPLYLMQTWNLRTMVANLVAKYYIYIRLDIDMYNIQRDAITANRRIGE